MSGKNAMTEEFHPNLGKHFNVNIGVFHTVGEGRWASGSQTYSHCPAPTESPPSDPQTDQVYEKGAFPWGQ